MLDRSASVVEGKSAEAIRSGEDYIEMPKQKPPTLIEEKSHPLVGAGLHWKDENGTVQSQATVVAVIASGGAIGDLALIQSFEWFDGSPSTRRLIPLSELASSDRWVFYSSVEEMKDHYDRVDCHHGTRVPT